MAVLSRRVRPEDWRPVGVNALETNALKVVRSADNRSVIAGPGAGKTELLAQRAAYLLQTGFAPAPRRILAISFKRDAATNLAARVRQRCHRNHAERFDSMTFDAFAKGLIDRFGQALPERWRPRPDYEIMFPAIEITVSSCHDRSGHLQHRSAPMLTSRPYL
jgi:superfamily I DNA/RNA helicase